MRTAANLKPGESAIIEDIDNNHPSSRRIMEVGFTPGEKIQLVFEPIFKDPIALTIRGTVIAIRKHEAECIIVGHVKD